MVKCLENTKCEATQENLDKLLKLVGNTVSSYKQALYHEAYFYVKDDILNWGYKDCIDPTYWNMFDTIHLVDGKFQYIEETVVEEKPKNNFKKFGFEADFEGEILKEFDCFFIGWIKDKDIQDNDIFKIGKFLKVNGNFYASTENGEVNIKKYNLKPIKKEWYENIDNIGKLVINIKTNKLFIYGVMMENILFGTDLLGNEVKIVKDYVRPATKEEVLSLLVKEE